MSDSDIELIKAGDAFRRTLIDKADALKGTAPLWHGWAIMDAFCAGARYALEKGEPAEAGGDEKNIPVLSMTWAE